MKATDNTDALNAFVAAKANIDELLATLISRSAEHFGVEPDDVHWGHVGDLRYVVERLTEACDFIAPGSGHFVDEQLKSHG